MGIITYHNFLENQSLIEAEKLEFLHIAISLTKFKIIVCLRKFFVVNLCSYYLGYDITYGHSEGGGGQTKAKELRFT